MLSAESIQKRFSTRGGELVVLRDVSLALAPGESAVVMGPSGSGKSTLLNILGTLEPPSAGRVVLDGCDPFSLSDRELARFRNRRVGFVFQDHHLLPQCSVLENVLLPTLATKDDAPTNAARDSSAGQATPALERARTLLARVGLTDRLEHRPAELSGGERQRAALARALINRPVLLLADEPTGNLDRATAELVAELLVELHREQNTMLVLVTHSEQLARRFGRRFDLTDGRLVPR